MRICQKKTTVEVVVITTSYLLDVYLSTKANVELVVIVLRMRQRSTKIFAHLDIYLDSITLTNFDTDFAPRVAMGKLLAGCVFVKKGKNC